MPRSARVTPAGSVQHVISRFIDRSYYLDVPGARRRYTASLESSLQHTDWTLLAYALMSTHVHLVLLAGERPLESLTKRIHVGFAHWLNRKSNRLGPVFAARPRSVTVLGDSAAALLAYVHNNPVRAGVVTEAAHSTWTSHRAYIGRSGPYEWLDVATGLRMSCFSRDAAGLRSFDDFVFERGNDPRDGVLSGDGQADARRAARVALAAPVELSTPFVHPSDDAPIRRLVLAAPSTPLYVPHPPDPVELLKLVSRATGVTFDELRSRGRRRKIVAARRVALLVWNRHFGRPTIEIARALGISASSASRLLQTGTPLSARHAAALAQVLLE